MSMEGIIPFVCGALKKRRRARMATEYERLSFPGATPTPETVGGGAYRFRSQSCRFATGPAATADAFDLPRDGSDRAPPPEGLPADEPFPPAGGGDGQRILSGSRRFSSMRIFACVGGA
ncbi:hypothetical protein ACP70R_044963 [Stipagrostis hirtigluma subsp. patula]